MGLITDKIIEGRKCQVISKNFSDSHYVAYNNKIWRIIGRQHFKIHLEREKVGETVWVDLMQEKVEYIISPTGHISV